MSLADLIKKDGLRKLATVTLATDATVPALTAEREARSKMRVYRYRLGDRPGTWLTMIAPGCGLDEAKRALELRFGERLLDVAEHPRSA